MSRARHWTHPETGETHWFNVYEQQATTEQVELLAEVEEISVDDLLDANLSSREVIFRLNKFSDLIPEAGLRQKARREHPQEPPTCVICSVEGWECQGRMTRHHFVPKWMMLELKDYEEYAPRTQCTVWVCASAHRYLHLRYANGASKSIAKYLQDHEKQLAHHLIAAFRDERPRIYALIAGGDRTSYEWQLVQDWRRGLFDVAGVGKAPFPRWKQRAKRL